MRFYVLLGSIGVALIFNLNAQQNRTFEFWSSQGISQRLVNGFEISLLNEERVSTVNGVKFRSEEVTPSLIWHYSPRYDFQVGYEGEIESDISGKTTETHRAFMVASVKFEWGKWSLKSNQRIDGGDRGGESVADFRHETRLESAFFSERWRPFISEEWYLDLIQGQVSENRAQVGVLYRWNRALESEVYGMRRDLIIDADRGRYRWILGMNLKLKF